MAQSQTQTGNFTDAQLYEPNKVGIWNNRSVMIKAIGNQEGHSLSYLIEDENAVTQTVSASEVTVLGVLDIPPSLEQLQRVFGQAIQGRQTTQR